jgi:hypothetical protein
VADLSPPPDRTGTEKELQEVANMARTRDQAALDSIAYWDTGSPSYRWSEIAVAEHLKRGANALIAARDPRGGRCGRVNACRSRQRSQPTLFRELGFSLTEGNKDN